MKRTVLGFITAAAVAVSCSEATGDDEPLEVTDENESSELVEPLAAPSAQGFPILASFPLKAIVCSKSTMTMFENLQKVYQESSTSLLTYATESKCGYKSGYHPVITPTSYASVLEFTSFSYHAAQNQWHRNLKEAEKSKRYENQEIELEADLMRRGWTKPHKIQGKTGYENQTDDLTAVGSYNPELNLIVIAFHGSISGNKLYGGGDWEANYDSRYVKGSDLGIKYTPDNVLFHRGFANNFHSCEPNLYRYLSDTLATIPEYKLPQTWVMFDGHSKGAAEAEIAVAVTKVNMTENQDLKQYSAVNVGAIVFSAPRPFYGSQSQEWAHKVVGGRNILRINVSGDPVTKLPLKSDWIPWGFGGYRSAGVLHRDFTSNVNKRFQKAFGKAPSYFQAYIAGRHYGALAPWGEYEFNRAIVVQYDELKEALEEGRKHMGDDVFYSPAYFSEPDAKDGVENSFMLFKMRGMDFFSPLLQGPDDKSSEVNNTILKQMQAAQDLED